MKTNNFLRKGAAVLAAVSLGLAFSCEDAETPYEQEAAYVAEESITDYYYEDADDMAGVAVASEEGTAGSGKLSSSAGILAVTDDRFPCANVTIDFSLESTLQHPIGDIVIDFGAGCEDPRGNVRGGIIRIHFEGRRFLPGSSITITFENYFINGIILKGTRTLTNISESTENYPKFQVELVGSIEWPDGTNATREHCYTREWVRANNPLLDAMLVNQCGDVDFAASGTNRRGIEYKMLILEELVYKRGCPIAVQGVKKFIEVATGKEITVDYGDGECDRIVTITVDGNSRSVNVGRR